MSLLPLPHVRIPSPVDRLSSTSSQSQVSHFSISPLISSCHLRLSGVAEAESESSSTSAADTPRSESEGAPGADIKKDKKKKEKKAKKEKKSGWSEIEEQLKVRDERIEQLEMELSLLRPLSSAHSLSSPPPSASSTTSEVVSSGDLSQEMERLRCLLFERERVSYGFAVCLLLPHFSISPPVSLSPLVPRSSSPLISLSLSLTTALPHLSSPHPSVPIR